MHNCISTQNHREVGVDHDSMLACDCVFESHQKRLGSLANMDSKSRNPHRSSRGAFVVELGDGSLGARLQLPCCQLAS